MSRYIRNTVILAKIETTAGTDAVPTGAADAMLVSSMSITPLDAQNINRDLVRGWFGGSEQLVGPNSVKCSFTVELAGSGTANTPPAWGALMRACGFSQAVLTTPNRVEYTPVSSALPTVTIDYHDDGVRHKILGAMGNVKISAKVGERPTMTFDFTGLDGGVSAVANATPTLSAWRTPVPMTRANVVDITLGCSYAAGVLSGGIVYPSTGLELDMGNQVAFTPLLNVEEVDITQRDVTGSIQLELTAAQEVTLMGTVKANTTQGLGLTIGTVTGNRFILFSPNVQLISPSKSDINGKRMVGFSTRHLPGNTGNDEFRIAHI
jgi:hypothetical protein